MKGRFLLCIIIVFVLLFTAVTVYADTMSMINPKVFKEPGWTRNAEKAWVYKREYPFTPYEEPQYGYCTANKVTVRKVPDITWRKLGYLIEGAPFIILGECTCEDTLLCDTAHGQGWIPRRYLELLSGEEEYNDYKGGHPSTWNKDELDPPVKKDNNPGQRPPRPVG